MEHGPDSPIPPEFGEAEQPKRRHEETVWQSIPVVVKVTAALCLTSLVVFLYLNRNRVPAEPELKPVKPKVTAGEAFDKVITNTPASIDLVLTKAALNPSTGRIEGVISNTSTRRYLNVEVVLFISPDNLTTGTNRVINVARLEPHESAQFATERVDPNTKQWAVKSIGGTPR